MKDQKKIKKEIEATGLRVEYVNSGFKVYPNSKDDRHIIWYDELKIILSVMQKYNLVARIDFEEGYVRLH